MMHLFARVTRYQIWPRSLSMILRNFSLLKTRLLRVSISKTKLFYIRDSYCAK